LWGTGSELARGTIILAKSPPQTKEDPVGSLKRVPFAGAQETWECRGVPLCRLLQKLPERAFYRERFGRPFTALHTYTDDATLKLFNLTVHGGSDPSAG